MIIPGHKNSPRHFVGGIYLGLIRIPCGAATGIDCNIAPLYSQSFNNPPSQANLDTLRAQNRKGPYLDITSISVFKLGNLFGSLTGGGVTLKDTYVLCDVFGVRNTQAGGKNVKAGTPILYYRANPASKDHITSSTYSDRIYNVDDNRYLVDLQALTPDGSLGVAHRLGDSASKYKNFYNFITDTRAPIAWPYKPDSYILISAGPDGEYGTRDDICNF